MTKPQLVEPGKIVTILFAGPSSKPLRVIINNGKLTRYTSDPVHISPQAPLAKAIINHKEGEEIEFQAPEGKLEVKIVSVQN